MAELKITQPLKILDLTDITGNVYDNDLYKSIISSSLIYNSPSNKGWDKPEYIFTRFIADCAIYLGFNAIKYKSRYSIEGENFVIFKDKVVGHSHWDKIYQTEKFYEFEEDDLFFKLLYS